MIGRLNATVLETRDPHALGRFYSELTGLPITRQEDDWVTLTGGPVKLSFQLAPGHRPPTFPDPASSMQMHLDIRVDDIDEAEPKVLALGAKRLDGEGDDFRVYADPDGHPFCLIWTKA
jgi:catechol 2,3-dioxygenase-like lactoylglutathione lyase family enzyme